MSVAKVCTTSGVAKTRLWGGSGWTTSAAPIYNAAGQITGSSSAPAGSTFNNGIFTKTVTSDNANIAAAVTQPQVFYGNNGNPWGDGADQLWGASGNKSPFDPCPAGWRVPAFENNTSPWNRLTVTEDQRSSFDTSKGYSWGDLGYYPAAGYRVNSTGTIYGAGSYGYYWSSLVSSTTSAYNLYFFSATVYTRTSRNRSYGNSLRCVASQN